MPPAGQREKARESEATGPSQPQTSSLLVGPTATAVHIILISRKLTYNPAFAGTAPTGEAKVPSPDQKCLHTSTTPTTRGRNRWSPGLIPPRMAWKTQPHWLIGGWLGFVEPAPPGEDEISSTNHKSFHTSTTPMNRRRKQ